MANKEWVFHNALEDPPEENEMVLVWNGKCWFEATYWITEWSFSFSGVQHMSCDVELHPVWTHIPEGPPDPPEHLQAITKRPQTMQCGDVDVWVGDGPAPKPRFDCCRIAKLAAAEELGSASEAIKQYFRDRVAAENSDDERLIVIESEGRQDG